jgi:hypothetical protein
MHLQMSSEFVTSRSLFTSVLKNPFYHTTHRNASFLRLPSAFEKACDDGGGPEFHTFSSHQLFKLSARASKFDVTFFFFNLAPPPQHKVGGGGEDPHPPQNTPPPPPPPPPNTKPKTKPQQLKKKKNKKKNIIGLKKKELGEWNNLLLNKERICCEEDKL